jgi:acyl carrier protein
MEVKQGVRQFVLTNFYINSPEQLSDDASLLEQGVVDSTGVLEVIAFLEGEYGIQVADSETTPENLDSINRITAYVERKRLSEGGKTRAAG